VPARTWAIAIPTMPHPVPSSITYVLGGGGEGRRAVANKLPLSRREPRWQERDIPASLNDLVD
jgi:hypothetical protein